MGGEGEGVDEGGVRRGEGVNREECVVSEGGMWEEGSRKFWSGRQGLKDMQVCRFSLSFLRSFSPSLPLSLSPSLFLPSLTHSLPPSLSLHPSLPPSPLLPAVAFTHYETVTRSLAREFVLPLSSPKEVGVAHVMGAWLT